MLAMNVRSGLVAFLSAAVFILALRPQVGRLVLIVAALVIVVLAMAALDVRFTPSGASREFSLDLLSDSLLSVVGDSERNDLESTKGWRLNWWRLIRDYTIDDPIFGRGRGTESISRQ